MSSIVEIDENLTEIRINVNAPYAEVITAIDDLAKELNLYSDDAGVTLESVAQATKNWWFEKVILQKEKQIAAYAKAQQEAIIAEGLTQLNNSPLRGA